MNTPKQLVKPGTLTMKESIKGILIIALLFFIFGFVSWINSILIPYFRIGFELSHLGSYLVAFAFYISYLVFSIPASVLLKKIGFKKGMMSGFWAMALGALLFVPAAYTMRYEIFLLGLFSIGAGLAILQTAANPYVTILGPIERGAQRISIMGICNKAAGILAPLLFAAVILRSSDPVLFEQLKTMSGAAKESALAELIGRVIVPYSCVSLALLLLGVFIRISPLPEIDTEHETDELAQANSGKTSILQFPHLMLGALAWFFHVGTQVISIDTVINYAGSMGIDLLEAKTLPSYTLLCSIMGYLLGVICIPRFVSQSRAIQLFSLLGAAITLLIVFAHGEITLFGYTADVSLWFVVLLGLANSLIDSAIWPLALKDLGRFTKIGSSIMVMGLSGNAILPLIYGYFADKVDERSAYWVLMPCYLYIIFYALLGYKFRAWAFHSSKNQLKKQP